MKKITFAAALLGIGLLCANHQANAAGCVSGAAVGGVAGHVAGHHAVLGAAAGCAIGHHEANKPVQPNNSNSTGAPDHR
jgi:hypothetical protein